MSSLIKSLLQNGTSSHGSFGLESMDDSNLDSKIAEHDAQNDIILKELHSAITDHNDLVDAQAAAVSLTDIKFDPETETEKELSENEKQILSVATENISSKFVTGAVSLEALTVALEEAAEASHESLYTTAEKSMEFVEAAYPVILEKARRLKKEISTTKDENFQLKTSALSVNKSIDKAGIIKGLKELHSGSELIFKTYLPLAEDTLVKTLTSVIDTSAGKGSNLFLLLMSLLAMPTKVIAGAVNVAVGVNRTTEVIETNFNTMSNAIKHIAGESSVASGEVTIQAPDFKGLEVVKGGAVPSGFVESLSVAEVQEVLNIVIAICSETLNNVEKNKGHVAKIKHCVREAYEADRKRNSGIMRFIFRLFRVPSMWVASFIFSGRFYEPLKYSHYAHKSMVQALSYVEHSSK